MSGIFLPKDRACAIASATLGLGYLQEYCPDRQESMVVWIPAFAGMTEELEARFHARTHYTYKVPI